MIARLASRIDPRAFVVPLALIATAEVAMLLQPTTSDNLAPPHAVAQALAAGLLDGTIAEATFETLVAAMGGLAIGTVLGLALGIAFGLSAIADRLSEVSVESIRPIPSVALIPISMLVFGFGFNMEIAVVGFTTIWPIMIVTRSAIRGLEPRLIEVSRALTMSYPAFITKIVMPAITPRVFVGMRLGAGIALIVAVTTEIAANPIGLGAAIMAAQQALRPDLMLALLVWIGLVGLLLNVTLGRLERLLFRGPAAPTRREP